MAITLETVSTIFATMSIASVISAVAILIFLIAASRSADIATKLKNLQTEHSRNAMMLASYVAIFCMLGSLYLSDIALLIPCQYCWYQRIAMYPLGLILGVALIKNEYIIRPYALMLSGVGALISLYHINIQLFPDSQKTSCSEYAPCTIKYLEVFDFMTIPMMAFSGFFFIFTLMLFVNPSAIESDFAQSE
ncbi:MAG: disulfide bond formation protein B [Euryarchaeota archaeon]|jgi:disulfide bond formation protein DsbB|nr:disulfide bond formation protein B [Euryarchaeota archaeon]MBT3971823.1 disulfide bond formation protein B [Euryarchaeota archaeon]MBT4408129.1 disulfide bond formation protein B [Euryarchaeota archaeon]MBT6644547.1 disulfide bond formation protein B [Euryarchaeota archaeon]